MTTKLTTCLLGGFLASSLLSSSALAAVVQPVNGHVQIIRGNGLERVTSAVDVRPGERVMASPNSSAKLVYPDGCVVKIRPGSVVSVGAKSPCTAQYLLEGQSDRDYGLLPFAAGAGGAFLAYCLNTFCEDDGRNRPASP